MSNQSKSCKTCIHRNKGFTWEECGATGYSTGTTKQSDMCGGRVNWKYWSPKPQRDGLENYLLAISVIGVIVIYILVWL